jgi:hypothetical protein
MRRWEAAVIDEEIDARVDIVYGGYFRALCGLLIRAENDAEVAADCRIKIAELGREMKNDGAWRGAIKNADGWQGHKTAWLALEAFITANRTDKPWWGILQYADGQAIDETVTRFFKSN